MPTGREWESGKTSAQIAAIRKEAKEQMLPPQWVAAAYRTPELLKKLTNSHKKG